MDVSSELKAARRDEVLQSYKAAEATNNRLFLEKDYKATEQYIFPNQQEDAHNIVNLFYQDNFHVVSIQKKTKVGADGLMIEIAKLLTTHIDDNFVIDPRNVRIITGMSNKGWERDMKEKSPTCFKDKIFHHGKLTKADLKDMTNSLIIIDEVDTGDKDEQRLHKTLKEAGILDVKHIKDHNNKFVFISATMIRELYDLYRWGSLHSLYNMTIPDSYIGHNDFLRKEIVKEFYPLTTKDNVKKWIKEDILNNYKSDYRVHIVRVKNKYVKLIQDECILTNINFKFHTSDDRLDDDEIDELFNQPLTQHIVVAVKNFFRRANLIPNSWKLRIGATHENYTKTIDNNVQIQGLTGRMTGYWRDTIEGGHKTGPYRTSTKAIEEYEKVYKDPFGKNSYRTAGFKKKDTRVTRETTMLSPKNVPNLNAVDGPNSNPKKYWAELKKEELEVDYNNTYNLKGKKDSYIKKFQTFIENKRIPSYASLAKQNSKEIVSDTYVKIIDVNDEVWTAVFKPENYTV